jgi:DNA polymerase-3 subunit beta
VERVSLIIDDRLKSPLRCVFSDGVVRISSSTPLGMAYDECPVTGSAENLEIGFNNKYILDALKAAPADYLTVQLTSGVAPCVMLPTDESDSFIYMILPVRLRPNEN